MPTWGAWLLAGDLAFGLATCAVSFTVAHAGQTAPPVALTAASAVSMTESQSALIDDLRHGDPAGRGLADLAGSDPSAVLRSATTVCDELRDGYSAKAVSSLVATYSQGVSLHDATRFVALASRDTCVSTPRRA
jgi:hypothetical protein